jgi:hypothetical protein
MTEKPSANSGEEVYTSAMRIYGGIAWGTLLSLLVATTMIILPQVPRPWLWGVLPLWMGLSGIGVLLQWSVARGACPKCGRRQSTTPMMTKCPQCRSYLKAVNRKIVKVG